MENIQLENIPSENNQAIVVGTVVSDLQYSHESYGEKFYSFQLEIPRLSEITDRIRITISERFFTAVQPSVGDLVMIHGQFRSYNNFSNVGNKLILTVFVKDIERITDIDSYINPNSIFLNGYVCKPPVYRTTPFQREIADILLAVNRSYNKSDYIPCIAWGRNAKFAETLAVGTNLKVWGRIQSRAYKKRIGEEQFEEKTAYEISISKMEIAAQESLF